MGQVERATYTTSLASAHIIRRTDLKPRVAHEDGGFDVVARDAARAGKSLLRIAVAAEGVVEDL